jgi:hypothetical protein
LRICPYGESFLRKRLASDSENVCDTDVITSSPLSVYLYGHHRKTEQVRGECMVSCSRCATTRKTEGGETPQGSWKPFYEGDATKLVVARFGSSSSTPLTVSDRPRPILRTRDEGGSMSGPWGSSNSSDVDVDDDINKGASHGEESTPPEPPLAAAADPPFRCSCRASSSAGNSNDSDGDVRHDKDAGSSRPLRTAGHDAKLRSGDIGGSVRSSNRAGDEDQDDDQAGGTLPPSRSSSSSSLPLDHTNSKLCDRERESDQLRSVFDRCCSGGTSLDCGGDYYAEAQQSSSPQPPPTPSYRGELALVTGPSGCGKTCLVKAVFREALRRRRRRREVGKLLKAG